MRRAHGLFHVGVVLRDSLTLKSKLVKICSASFEYKNYIVVLLYKLSTRDAQLTALGRSLKIMNVRLLHYERLPRLRTFDKVQNVGSNMSVGGHVFRALDLLN